MLTKNQEKLADHIMDYMQELDGEAYSEPIYKLVKEKTNDISAKKYIKLYEKDPEKVVNLIIDRSYYRVLGYPMDRKQKSTKSKSKRKLTKKPLKKLVSFFGQGKGNKKRAEDMLTAIY